MVEGGNALSRNPNICASCSSLADAAEDSNLPAVPGNPATERVQASVPLVPGRGQLKIDN
jgi:hypothetical protein